MCALFWGVNVIRKEWVWMVKNKVDENVEGGWGINGRGEGVVFFPANSARFSDLVFPFPTLKEER